MRQWSWFILVAVLLSAGARAQISPDTTYSLEGVEVRTDRKSTVPAGNTLDFIYLSKSALLKNQGNTFINTLEKLPGISSINTGVGISKPVIRGLSLNRVIVNEYGIKQEGQQWGVDHGLEIDQFNVDQVEVLKGPVSLLYGADGIGGVINILPPLIPEKNTFGGEALVNYKSNNDLFGASLRLQQNTNDFYTIVRATWQDYASYRVPTDEFTYNSYQLPIYNRRLKNTAGREHSISVLNGIRRDWGHSNLYISNYNQHAGFFTGAFGVPRAYQLADDGKPRSIGLPYQTINHLKIVSNTHFHFHRNILEVDLGYQHNRRQELSLPHAHGNGPAPEGNLALQLDLHTLTGNVRYKFHPLEAWEVITGVSLQHQENIRDGYEFLIPGYKVTQGGVYVFSEYKITDRFLVSGGARADAADQRADRSYVRLYNDDGALTGVQQRSPQILRQYVNGSGSLGIAWTLADAWKLKTNAGSAYRIPAMVELTANGVHHGTFRHEMGDSSLRAERGYMLDAGLYFRKGRVKADVTPYLNYFTNYIYLRPSAKFSSLPEAGQVYLYTQAQALFTGFESNIDIEVTSLLNNRLSFEYVWNRNLDTRVPLPFTPPFSVLNEIEYKPAFFRPWLRELFFALSGQYFAAQRRVDVNEPETDGYFLLHFSAGNTFPAGKRKISLFAQVRNITNTRYLNNMSRYRILNLPEQGINTQIILRYEL